MLLLHGPSLLLCLLSLNGCEAYLGQIDGMLGTNPRGSHPLVVKATLVYIPLGGGPGNGRQFDKDDFSFRQWDLRPVTPGL
jgi:hypothetical protein